MKKTYLFLTALVSLALAPFTAAHADDDVVTVELSQNTGFWTDWNNNASNPWAKTWETTAEDPHITIHQASNANNMRFWDGTWITFYNSLGGSTDNEDYNISVSTGWDIIAVSLEFACSNTAGVAVTLNGEESAESSGEDDFQLVAISDLETQEVVMNVATLTAGTTTFANTRDFVVTLRKQTGIAVAEAEFLAILHKYELYEETDFPVGDAPGLYPQEAHDAFFAALQAGLDIDQLPIDDLTEEKYKELGDNIVSAYEALVASRNMTYTLPEGYKYFHVRAGMTYVNDGEDAQKYLYTVLSGDTYYGYWASPTEDDALDAIQRLWKITPSVNSFDMVNCYSQGRFNNVATSTNTTLDPKGDNLMAFDPVYTDEDGVTLINIRVATQDANKTLYLHQNSHGGGTGTQGTVVGWSSTWTYDGGPAATEWVLEPVSDEEAQAILEAGAAAIAREQFENDYSDLIETANLALQSAQADCQATPLITEASQFSSEWTDTDEGTDLGALIDNDPTTYWHSNWHNGSVAPGTHSIDVALPQAVHQLVRVNMRRRQVSGNHITGFKVLGSNDPEAEEDAWQPVAILYTPYSGSYNVPVLTRFFDTKGFTNLRFVITGNTGGSGLGHMSEFQLEALGETQSVQYTAIAEKANALTAVIAEQEFTPVAEVTEEQSAALTTAYEQFRKVFIDPTELRDLIAKAEGLANGVIAGTQPGYWTDNSLGTALAAIITSAKAYDEAGTYTAEQSNAFIDQLQQAMEPILAAAIGIKEGKWYNIRFGSEATFEDNGWDLVAGEAVMSEAEEGEESYEIDEPLWDKLVTVAKWSSSDGVHYVLPIDAEDVRLGNYLFVDEKSDIENPDLALFRFVNVGDTAYVIQNKATGLFIHTGVTGAVTMSIHPSLFNVSAIGYGQNIIKATDLEGTDNNNLHIQRSYNMVVTWDADTPGSRSGLYLDEVADVAADYDGADFFMDIREGQIYTFCYPAELTLGEDNTGEMWTVNGVEENTVRLAKLEKVNAGRPFIYIAGETDAYDAEAEAQPEVFRHGYTFAAQPETEGLFRGTYTSITPGAGFLIVNESQRNSLIVSHAMMENSTVGAYEGYIAPEEGVSGEIEIELTDEEDGIQTAIANVSRTGDIYTLDGRLVGRGNLNTVSRLASGIYIVNGTKVAVK